MQRVRGGGGGGGLDNIFKLCRFLANRLSIGYCIILAGPHWRQASPDQAGQVFAVCLGYQGSSAIIGAPQGFWGSGENGYLFSGDWGALVIILGELGSKLIILGI